MGRRAKSPKGKAEPKRSSGRKPAKNAGAQLRDPEQRLAEALKREAEALRREAEALEQQTATSEILRVISESPTDAQPVFDAIAASAVRLCESTYGVVHRFDGTNIEQPIALCNVTDEQLALYRRIFPLTASMYTALGESVVTRRTVHVEDTLAERRYNAGTEAIRVAREALGYRTLLVVPMVHRDKSLGVITVWRREQRPFLPKQIALVETFANQAVIAIENVRLFTETKEALEQQTATAEILKVIASSPTDTQPVLDAIAENAARLCSVEDVFIVLVAGDALRAVAATGQLIGSIPDYNAQRVPVSRTSVAGRVIVDRTTMQIDDLAAVSEDELPDGRALQRMFNHRTILATPLLREGAALGAIVVFRLEVRPFSERQQYLLQTFADQAVIAIENVRLFTELQESNRELTSALDTQTATSDILRVISRSPTDVQPVFDAIVRSALQLLGGHAAVLLYLVGDDVHVGAYTSTHRGGDSALASRYPMPVEELARQNPPLARVLVEGLIGHVPDSEAPGVDDFARSMARTRGHRSRLMVPLRRNDSVLGGLAVTRVEPGPFSEEEITLLQTFADQAVIAIENVRLFTELQASNRELTTALDQQTATSDILGVISRSQTDVQPVFDAIVLSARRLLGAHLGAVTRRKGDHLELAAFTSTGAGDDTLMTAFPLSLQGTGAHATAVRDCAPVRIADALTDSDVHEGHRAIARAVGYRSMVVVPLLRQDVAVGTISVARSEPGGFTDDEIALLQTFADQAVIAIENARLLSELQETNDSLTQAHARVSETLERQTAMSEILRTISSSPTDLAPTFDAILRSSTRLTGATHCAVIGFDGEMLTLLATNAPPEADESMHRIFPYRPNRTGVAGRVVLDRAIVHIPDVTQDPDYGFQNTAAMAEYRAILGVPMFRETEVIGALHAARAEPGPFSDTQIELFRTFADQAVIAIENVRLFKELEARTTDLARSVQQLTALGEVGRAVSSTLDLETVLTTIVARAVELSRLDGGVVFEYEEAAEEFVHRAATETGGALAEARRATRVRKGEGVVGRTAITLEPVQVPDITVPGAHESRLRENLIESGVRAILAVPMVREGRLIGSLVVSRNHPGDFPTDTIELLRTFATQSALAIQNARLFHEIADKSQQLEAASRHKSEFLANMSHELRTPLNAIIGFSEILAEKMFGDINEKQTEYLQDILESGRHLLSLINDILDLSKIEAGRMELEATDFDLPSAIDNALTLVRERATRRGITLGRTIDEQLGMLHGDERKVKQVLLNLLSNALKFTPEGGRIDVSAGVHDDVAEVSVADTGVGIAPEDQEAVFEEFRQVGTADKKVEGTGLGLALSRKFIELHGGRIWVQSEVGKGSTFRFTLPMS